MKYHDILLCLFLLLAGCGQKNSERYTQKHIAPDFRPVENQQDSLLVTTARYDTLNPATDSLYGVGDDDLFTARDPEMYKVKDGKWKEVSDLINDYDLTTCIEGQLGPGQSDTFSIIIAFEGIANNPDTDTNGIVNTIDIFNGNRKSLSFWEKSGKVKDIQIWHNSTFQGAARLRNTYKCQSVNLKHPVPLLSGQADTFSIIIQSCYSSTQQENYKYAISEIKPDGERKY